MYNGICNRLTQSFPFMKYDIAALPIKKPYEMQRRTLYPHSQEKGNKPQPYDKTPPHVFLFYPMDPIHPPRRRRRWSLRIQVPSALPIRHPRHHTTSRLTGDLHETQLWTADNVRTYLK